MTTATTMMMQPFQFEGHEVRFVGTAERPEWVASDVCAILGLKNVSEALRALRQTEKRDIRISDVPLAGQEIKVVTEPGLYRLIFKSKKAEALRFQDWVFETALPQIRRTGGYGHGGMLVELERLRSELADSQRAVQLLAEISEKHASLSGMILGKRSAQIKLEDKAFAAIEHGQQLLLPDAGPVRTVVRRARKRSRREVARAI